MIAAVGRFDISVTGTAIITPIHTESYQSPAELHLAQSPKIDYTDVMQLSSRFSEILKYSFILVLLVILFAISYTQSPLYTSNQNQYFLHGLAKAGYGYLDRDWLGNTLDPTPVFSWLVAQIYQLTGQDSLFYLLYALLMGLYLYCLLGIANSLYDIYKSRTKTLLLISLLFLVHSAALRFVLSRTIGVNWTYVFEDGVAGQRMLGPVFQPSTFGVFLLFSVYLFMRQRPILAVLMAVLAATVHPTYILSAAALTATYMLVTYIEHHHFLRPLRIGLIALLVIFPILFYVYTSFTGIQELTVQARDILVNYRIPHHAIVSEWFDASTMFKILLIIGALYLIRKTSLFLVLLVPAITAATLTLVQILTGSDFLALLFPWRISILIVPLSTTIIISYVVTKLISQKQLQSPRISKSIQIASVLLILLTVLIGGIRIKIDFERKATAGERQIQQYVYANKKADELYLVPVKMQDFRLFTGAPAFIGFKSIPYRDADVLEWYRRIGLADQFYLNEDCKALNTIQNEYKVTHVIIPSEMSPLRCPSYAEIYADDHYHLYRFIERSIGYH